MIIYHGLAMRWLHPHYKREATVAEESGNQSRRVDEPCVAVAEAGDQLMLMPLSEGSKPPLKRRNDGRPRKSGHAGVPGTGPVGETCGTCRHYRAINSRAGGSFRKCELMRSRWTKGPGSDIRKGDRACNRWEAKVAA
jgi:hypothetical protein